MSIQQNENGYLEDEGDNQAPIELQEYLAEDCLKLDGLNEAIVGVTSQGYLVYDYEKIIEVFMKEPSNMEYDEAIEFFDYNVLGLEGNGNWVIMKNREYYV
jgi:hypothetical protein|tara:strand:+ start:1876 stop:2178 length:303 start_codon:yes stop_codon:yes gene_type:complete